MTRAAAVALAGWILVLFLGARGVFVGTREEPPLLSLLFRPAFGPSPVFVAWNLFGILDLVVAVGLGGAVGLEFVGGLERVTMVPVAQLPLVLTPAYLVPIFVMLHLTAIFQARTEAASERSPGLFAGRSETLGIDPGSHPR